jgi:hypothetical protein
LRDVSKWNQSSITKYRNFSVGVVSVNNCKKMPLISDHESDCTLIYPLSSKSSSSVGLERQHIRPHGNWTVKEDYKNMKLRDVAINGGEGQTCLTNSAVTKNRYRNWTVQQTDRKFS